MIAAHFFLTISLFLGLICLPSLSKKNSKHINCDEIMNDKIISEIKGYEPTVKRIINKATQGKHKGKIWKELADFVDKFGARLSGSKNLENSIDYILNKSIAYRLDNVHGEPVSVPYWVRGHEEATLLKPRLTKLNIVGLAGSIGTPPEGITGKVMVVEDIKELKEKKDQIAGKIVVTALKIKSYDWSFLYRKLATIRVAAAGGLASLVRSVTKFSIDTPHTGWHTYAKSGKKIPAAALTAEDSEMLLRMAKRGEEIVINLKMNDKQMDDQISRNVIADIEGSKFPKEQVLLSGHIDSWDIGTGAMDDGGGAFIAWYSLVLLKQLKLRPKRTIRALLTTGEEPGLYGATAYHKAHSDNDLIILMESDDGTFSPEGIMFNGVPKARCIMEEILNLMKPINASTMKYNPKVGFGTDLMMWSRRVPKASLMTEIGKYFWFHHSAADRMTVEDPDDLDRCLALWTGVAYVLADLSIKLPR